jgi:hypothetical protein
VAIRVSFGNSNFFILTATWPRVHPLCIENIRGILGCICNYNFVGTQSTAIDRRGTHCPSNHRGKGSHCMSERDLTVVKLTGQEPGHTGHVVKRLRNQFKLKKESSSDPQKNRENLLVWSFALQMAGWLSATLQRPYDEDLRRQCLSLGRSLPKYNPRNLKRHTSS